MVRLGDDCMLSSETFSVEMWVAPESPADFARLFTQGSQCDALQLTVVWHKEKLHVYSSTERAEGDPHAATRSLTNGAFAHFAWTFDGRAHRLFLNGEQSEDEPSASDLVVEGGNYLGARDAGDLFDGRLQDVALYDEPLSAVTVRAHYLAGRASGPAAPGPLEQTGSLRQYLLDWEAAEVPRQTTGYTPPTEEQSTDMARSVTDLIGGRLGAAADRVRRYNYEVVRFHDTDTGRVYRMLRERRLSDGQWFGAWGTYIWSPDATSDLVVQSPHTVSDWRLTEISTHLFQQADAQALMLAGAGRWAGGDTELKSTDPADVANFVHGPTVFQEVHESLLERPGAYVVQLHGFDHEGEADIVVSSGDADPSPWVRELASAYSDLDLPNGVRLFANEGGSADTELTARQNPQGVTAGRAGVPWVHVELSRSVRSNDSMLEALIRATAEGQASQ
jgi:hypothetical protein